MPTNIQSGMKHYIQNCNKEICRIEKCAYMKTRAFLATFLKTNLETYSNLPIFLKRYPTDYLFPRKDIRLCSLNELGVDN